MYGWIEGNEGIKGVAGTMGMNRWKDKKDGESDQAHKICGRVAVHEVLASSEIETFADARSVRKQAS